jgi:hypothetical protein
MPFKKVQKEPTQQEKLKAKADCLCGTNPNIKKLLEADCAPKTKAALDFLLNSNLSQIKSEKSALVLALCNAVQSDLELFK